jgi:hypothetical protein
MPRLSVPDRMTHAYLFNSCDGETLARVRENIAKSLERAPRPLRLIDVQPEEHETLIALLPCRASGSHYADRQLCQRRHLRRALVADGDGAPHRGHATVRPAVCSYPLPVRPQSGGWKFDRSPGVDPV